MDNRYNQREVIMHDLGLLKDELTEKFLEMEKSHGADSNELEALDTYIDALDGALLELKLMNEIVNGLIM